MIGFRAAPSLAIAAALASSSSIGCTSYGGTARPIAPSIVDEPGWIRAHPVELVRQHRSDDCGVAAAAMAWSRWSTPGEVFPLSIHVPNGGLTARDVRDLLRNQGLRAFVIRGQLEDLEFELAAGRPIVIGTVKRIDRRRGIPHFEVVVAIHPARKVIVTLDPAAGWRQRTYNELIAEWSPAYHTAIVALPRSESIARD